MEANDNDDLIGDVQSLLNRAEQIDDMVRELAHVCVSQFESECAPILEAHQKEGMALVFKGRNPDKATRKTLARIQKARQKLKERLEALLRWAESRTC